jgi:hypothetical protein
MWNRAFGDPDDIENLTRFFGDAPPMEFLGDALRHVALAFTLLHAAAAVGDAEMFARAEPFAAWVTRLVPLAVRGDGTAVVFAA